MQRVEIRFKDGSHSNLDFAFSKYEFDKQLSMYNFYYNGKLIYIINIDQINFMHFV